MVTHWATDYAAQLSENMAEAFLVIDDAFGVLHANPQAAALLGAETSQTLVGRKLDDKRGEKHIQFTPPLSLDDSLTAQEGRYRISIAEGPTADVDVKFVAADEGASSHIVFLSELKEEAELDSQFFQSERLAAMDNIVAGIAHELNNPMTAILGYAELLLATEIDAKRKKRIALIAEEADRCGKIIGNMLTFTRSFGNSFEQASVSDILEESVSLRAYQMRVDGITMETEYAATEAIGEVQPSAIRRLFLNILHNAHQALLEVPEDERLLLVRSRVVNDKILIDISDNGCGISDDIRYKIFDPFFTTRPLGEGMGLGLSVAYGIVHEHKGTITAEPREGGGTTMKVEFPRIGSA
jgi:two-component system, NtrC family, sensor kinase